jgi:hypothetical protein
VIQRERVLRSLQTAGPLGVCQADWLGRFNGSGTPDGGAPITRLAARVEELRGDGWPVVARGKRDGFQVYVLAQPAVDEGVEPAARLFQPAPGNAIIGEAA